MINIWFDWKAIPLVWGGFNKGEITELVSRIFGFYNNFYSLQEEDREKINIICGDHSSYLHADGKIDVPYAVAVNVFDTEGKLEHVDVVMNRSYEIVEHTFNKTLPDTLSFEGYKIEDNAIHVRLEEPWEVIAWLYGEEIDHAESRLASNPTELEAINYFYEMAQVHNMNNDPESYQGRIPYSLLLPEVLASRHVLLLLEDIIKESNPERAALFYEVYKLSLKKKMAVISRFEHIAEAVFVRTGYIPIEKSS